MIKKKFVLLLLLLPLHISALLGQQVRTESFGDGIVSLTGKDSSWNMNVSARFQLLGIAVRSSVNGNQDDFGSGFYIRRARLKSSGSFLSKFSYKLQLGLSNQDLSGGSRFTGDAPRLIYDAVVKWNFHGNFSLWAGQTKLPGNVERVISSGKLQFVNRSLLNAHFNIDRDIGIQLRHHFRLGSSFLIREKLAFTQGEGRNIATGNSGGYQYTTRLELLPLGSFTDGSEYEGGAVTFEQTPKVMIGVVYNYNDDAILERGNSGAVPESGNSLFQTDFTTVFIDGVLKWKRLSVLGEYAFRKPEKYVQSKMGMPAPNFEEGGSGINFQAGYMINGGLEFSGRFTKVELKKNLSISLDEEQYTIGVSRYIKGHNLKIQSDWTYIDNKDNGASFMGRIQMEVHF